LNLSPKHLLFIFILLAQNGHSQQQYGPESPAWLGAVGKLTVPGKQWSDGDWHHLSEHCSATLLRRRADKQAAYLLSAWHCIEHYRDLSYDITFELPGSSLVRRARLVDSGGSMAADWALLKLVQAVPTTTVTSMVIPAKTPAVTNQPMIMAGYSSGPLGKLGAAPLSYDSHCQILEERAALVTTDCQASKGASGGPVISGLGDNMQLLGVVSSGDGGSRSLYVPITVFAGALRQHL
jgi:hypothetical protein